MRRYSETNAIALIFPKYLEADLAKRWGSSAALLCEHLPVHKKKSTGHMAYRYIDIDTYIAYIACIACIE